jgi:hypothetical protein
MVSNGGHFKRRRMALLFIVHYLQVGEEMFYFGLEGLGRGI